MVVLAVGVVVGVMSIGEGAEWDEGGGGCTAHARVATTTLQHASLSPARNSAVAIVTPTSVMINMAYCVHTGCTRTAHGLCIWVEHKQIRKKHVRAKECEARLL
jgi:hypothetical protein